MKVLPKKSEVNALLQQERKSVIDQGIELATQIETLRRLKDEEERNLLEFRKGSLQLVQSEIDELISSKEELQKENKMLLLERKKLIEPLDNEWKALRESQQLYEESAQALYLEQERLKISQQKDKDIKKNIAISLKRVHSLEKESQKSMKAATLARERLENEQRMISNEHAIQNEEYQRRLDEVQLLKDTYQNGIHVTEVETKRLQEWENDLIAREQQLWRRSENLKKNYELAHGNTNSISNKPNTK